MMEETRGRWEGDFFHILREVSIVINTNFNTKNYILIANTLSKYMAGKPRNQNWMVGFILYLLQGGMPKYFGIYIFGRARKSLFFIYTPDCYLIQ